MNEFPPRGVKRRKKHSVVQAVRLILQIVFFIFLPALYINAFLDLKLVFASLMDGTFDITVLVQAIELIAIVPVTILLGRFFCGWMCAFGAFGDFIYRIVQNIFKPSFRISESTDEALKFVKYGILAFVIIFLWTLEVPTFRTASPWDVFGMLATVGASPDIAYVAANLTVGLVFLILIALGSAFVQRFFCRYLCPLGAVFAILSALKITRIAKPKTNCGKCRICTQNCAMGIPLYRKDSVHSTECIECLQCAAVCPRRNVSYCVAGSDVRPLLAGTAAAIVITGVYGGSNLALAASEDAYSTSAAAPASGELSASPSAAPTSAPASNPVRPAVPAGASSAAPSASASASPWASASATPYASASPSVSATQAPAPSASPSSGFADGTYTGSGTGFRGATTEVSVTIADGGITDITTVSHGDDLPYYERAFDSVASDIIGVQSTDVDAVSGATYSSLGIMEAVQDALDQATAA